jgi:hypothetical protein
MPKVSTEKLSEFMWYCDKGYQAENKSDVDQLVVALI